MGKIKQFITSFLKAEEIPQRICHEEGYTDTSETSSWLWV